MSWLIDLFIAEGDSATTLVIFVRSAITICLVVNAVRLNRSWRRNRELQAENEMLKQQMRDLLAVGYRLRTRPRPRPRPTATTEATYQRPDRTIIDIEVK